LDPVLLVIRKTIARCNINIAWIAGIWTFHSVVASSLVDILIAVLYPLVIVEVPAFIPILSLTLAHGCKWNPQT